MHKNRKTGKTTNQKKYKKLYKTLNVASKQYKSWLVEFDENKGIYKRNYKGKRWTDLKKLSHKKLRKSKVEKPSNKEFDIDWNYD